MVFNTVTDPADIVIAMAPSVFPACAANVYTLSEVAFTPRIVPTKSLLVTSVTECAPEATVADAAKTVMEGVSVTEVPPVELPVIARSFLISFISS